MTVFSRGDEMIVSGDAHKTFLKFCTFEMYLTGLGKICLSPGSAGRGTIFPQGDSILNRQGKEDSYEINFVQKRFRRQ